MTTPAPRAVFLSYASQDAEAAKCICDALRSSGIEVWFDTDGGLETGDEWDAKIRRQIKECVLFVPVISANTEARHEGYFRIEWDLAAERARGIAHGVPFILPVVIDDTQQPQALVPDRFRTVQWTRARDGILAPETRAKFAKLWSHRIGLAKATVRASAEDFPTADDSTASPGIPRRTRSRIAIGVSVGVVALIVVTAAVMFSRRPVAVKESSPSLSTAVQTGQFPRDPELRRALELTTTVNSIREDYFLAEEIAKRAVDRAPSDADAVTVMAHVQAAIVLRNFDFTADRTTVARRYCERAVQLAPDNPVALSALALFLRGRGNDLPRAEELARRATQLAPDEVWPWRVLSQIVRTVRQDEGVTLAEQVATRFPRDPLAHYELSLAYRDRGRYADAERELDATIALAPVSNALDWKARFALMHGDVPAMKQWLDRMPARVRSEERAVTTSVAYAFFSGDSEYGLNALGRYSESWFYDVANYQGPKALLQALLLERRGSVELARTHYEAALIQIQRNRTERPNDPSTHHCEALALVGLGRLEEARTAHRAAMELHRRPARIPAFSLWFAAALPRTLLVGDRETALALARDYAQDPESRQTARQRLTIDPRLVKFRDDPELIAILAEPAAPVTSAARTDMAVPVDDKSVAVLAFANLSDDKANEYFSDGISEELLNVLAKVPGLKVSARTSAFHFKGKDTPVPEIAKQLGVAYVVEGSVRKAGDKVRITAQLIKAADGFHVWSDTFTRDLKDVFAVQDEIAGLIAQKLSIKLQASDVTAASTAESYDLLLQARHFARQESNAGWRRAIELYQKVLTAAPHSASAWAGIADAYVQLGRFNGMPALEAMNEARTAARRALEFEPHEPTALAALGWVARTADWNWREARRYFARALAAQPGNSAIISANAILELNLGNTDGALTLAERAVAVDPLNASAYFNLGVVYYMLKRPADALPAYDRAIALAPTAEEYHCHRAVILALLGRHAEARLAWEAEPHPGYRRVAIGHCAALSGDRAEASRALAELIANHADDFPGYISDVCASQGDLTGALDWFDRAISRRDNSVPWFKCDLWHVPLRDHPRWLELIRRIGLSDDQLK